MIDDAVKNAVARRHEALDTEAALLPMSDEEAASVSGGTSLITDCKIIQGVIIKPPITLGKPYNPPITIGIVAPKMVL